MKNYEVGTAIFHRFASCAILSFAGLKKMNESINLMEMAKGSRMLILLLFTLILFSCEKEEEFKVPVDVGFYVDIQRTTDASSPLRITEGHMVLSSFEFEGYREQAADVRFEKEYTKGLLVAFSPNQLVNELRFQIPQGVYRRISISFETDGETEDEDDNDRETAGLVIKGIYRSEKGGEYPIVFELQSSEEFSLRAKSRADGDQVVLKREAPASAYIKLNPIFWFQAVPLSMLEQAKVIELDGVRTILINEEFNESIYDILEERVGKAAEILFVY